MAREKCNIIISFNLEGIHSWSNCPLPDVEFLKYPHRHLFFFNCKKKVYHDNRDIEVLLFRKKIKNYLEKKYRGNFGGLSCEMIARELLNKFNLTYCSVLEDNENGAEITRTNE